MRKWWEVKKNGEKGEGMGGGMVGVRRGVSNGTHLGGARSAGTKRYSSCSHLLPKSMPVGRERERRTQKPKPQGNGKGNGET